MSRTDHDRGAAAERTRLAWRRTTLAATVVTVLLIRLAIQDFALPPAVAVIALGGLCWVAVLAVANGRIRALAGAARPSRKELWLITASCACFAALGVVLVLA